MYIVNKLLSIITGAPTLFTKSVYCRCKTNNSIGQFMRNSGILVLSNPSDGVSNFKLKIGKPQLCGTTGSINLLPRHIPMA